MTALCIRRGWSGVNASVRLLACTLLLAACAAVPASQAPLTGNWGGPHVGLTLTPTGGELVYDCAAGRLTEPLMPRAGGAFEVRGTHTPGHGGPDVAGMAMPTYRTIFTSAVRGDRMSLTGRVENGVVLGPFALRRGTEPGIFRCL